MRLTVTVVYDDHEPGPVQSAVSESDALKLANTALTYGDRHQDYDLTAVAFVSMEESEDE